MVRALFSYRSHKAAIVLLLIVSLGLTQVPLFNYLGYEFSAIVALFWSLAAGLLTISLWNKNSGATQPEPLPFLGRSMALSLAPLLVPLVVITLNAFLVKNCSFIQGATDGKKCYSKGGHIYSYGRCGIFAFSDTLQCKTDFGAFNDIAHEYRHQNNSNHGIINNQTVYKGNIPADRNGYVVFPPED